MAASRVDSSRRLCARYRNFFIAAGVTLGLQILLCHYFLNLSQRTESDNLLESDIIKKGLFTIQNLNKQDSPINDKRISTNGGKGPPNLAPDDVVKHNVIRDTGYMNQPVINVLDHPHNDHPPQQNELPPHQNEPPPHHPAHPNDPALPQTSNNPPKVPGDPLPHGLAPQVPSDDAHAQNDDNTHVYVRDNEPSQDSPNTAAPASLPQYIPSCDVSAKDVSSAINRAKTAKCKQEIADVFCRQQNGTLYNLKLPNYCPNRGTDAGHYYGCYRDSMASRDLDGGMVDFMDNSPQKCIDHCFRSAMKYAALQFGKECWCGNEFGKHGEKLDEAHCFTKCPGNASETCGAYLANKIYGTGVQEIVRQEAPLEHPTISPNNPRVRIVFVLTVNGRALRQVVRLLRVIYSPSHFYYIHVDKRQEYLYRELLPLSKKYSNIYLTKNRFSTIWGGASLLQAHLSFIRELFEHKSQWKWDYYINLSESDYPVKPIQDLVEYLTAYKGLNFLRSFGKNVPRFIKKQGMDQTFHECEDHLWRVAPRPLPSGVVFDGGSDWVGLFSEFARYAVYSKDKLVTGLKQYYKYSLLPVESFFHMVLQNSMFCSQSVDNNLHLTNWRRKQGCKCQYKHIVDWCGCSPNDIKVTDTERLLHYDKKPMFFARKFEAIVDQEIINTVDVTFHGYQYPGVHSLSGYWQNAFHHLDQETKVKDSVLTIYTSLERLAVTQLKQNEARCDLAPLQLLEVTIYNEADHLHGLLVLFSARLKDTNKVVTLEAYAEPKDYFTREAIAGHSRLLSLEVSTDFDVKEMIFRNYGNLMGPYDEISLRHEWGHGAEVTVSIAWVDPTNEIAASYDVVIPASSHVGNQKPLLNKPLRPGVWRACIMVNLELVAQTQFLVSPLTFLNNKPIPTSEITKAHQGPLGLYTSTDFSEFLPNLKLTVDHKLQEEAIVNSKKNGTELEQWVDSLTRLFWVVQNFCVLEPHPECPSLDLCSSVAWSSRSPDVKSDMKYIGQQIPVVS